jgi:predicted dehydrogenase
LSQKTVAIVGCGLIGKKRKLALAEAQLIACVDVDPAKAQALASGNRSDVIASSNLSDALRANPDIVIVATTNDALEATATAALNHGCHVLIEKPGARNLKELARIEAAAVKAGRLVRIGFNHRYHPAMLKAKEIIESGDIGPLMIIRGRYGHGGRVGYDREWRANPMIAGGGELIDQGVHLIDLARWFLNTEFDRVEGFAGTFYWDMAVDDNAFMTLRTPSGATAFLHVSCSEWKNLFSLEIYGRTGKIHIEGLGGSYGVERLTWYRMLPEMGPPDTTGWEFPRGDRSWEFEFEEFLKDIEEGRTPSASLEAGRAVLSVVESIYQQSR